MLGDAKNWKAFEIGPMPSDNGMIIVTVERANGKSPVEMNKELKAEVEKYVDAHRVATHALDIANDKVIKQMELLNASNRRSDDVTAKWQETEGGSARWRSHSKRRPSWSGSGGGEAGSHEAER